jgi:HD-GYP domain-containing protein (c-di-GMP phosphodiesterase class II)
MSTLPITISRKTNTSSLEEEVSSLRMQLQIERTARNEAETALLMVDMAQENGDPPPSRMAMIAGLAKLAESRDDDTGTHLARIRQYTSIIASEYARQNPSLLPLGEVSIIAAASILHDIGKVGITDDVLLHPAVFSDEQLKAMKRHAQIGADILLALSAQLGNDPWIDTSIQIALSHHERWDGNGYPYGLRAEEINLPARIVAVADVYDALTSQRVYKKAMSHTVAVEIIKKDSGKHFDPLVVEAFLCQLEEVSEVRSRHHPQAETS